MELSGQVVADLKIADLAMGAAGSGEYRRDDGNAGHLRRHGVWRLVKA